MNRTVLRDVTPCNTINIYQLFGGTNCFHRKDIKGIDTKFSEQPAPTSELKMVCDTGTYVGVLISLWLFLFAAQPNEFFLNGLKKLE
jgi:hypothetical protein